MSPKVKQPAGEAFNGLGLSTAVLETLTALGYEEPTPIQREAIPPLLAGRDLLGEAATGTGKTAAFALPLLERIHGQRADGGGGDGGGGVVDETRRPRALILVPTRELAMQVAEAVHKYGNAAFGTCVVPVYGGQAIQQQLRALRRGVDVIVATPGRALDHIRRRSIDLSEVRFVVLDEADEMLDMGFAEDLEAILDALPAERQTALLSATIAPRVASIAERHLNDPVRVKIHREKAAAGEMPRVRQTAYVVVRQHKLAALGRVLDMEDPASAIVFCRTRGEVDQLSESLSAHGYRAAALHGGLTQEQRDRVMRRFREGSVELLIATDVAARGLDIENVSHVVNYDVPMSPDAYVHRIGRTGRAGRAGVAITFAEPRERRYLRNIEQLTKQTINTENVPTIVDLRARQLELTRAAIQELLVAGDLDGYRVVAETLGSEYDVMDVATAAIKLAHEARGSGIGTADEVEIPEVIVPRQVEVDGKRSKSKEKREKRSARNDRAGGGDVTRIYIGLGRSSGIRPKDIVGAIANEAGVSPKGIGAIDIADKFALVEVRGDEARSIIAALRGTTLRGKKVTVREDRPAARRT
ncbi:MAG TPA: DEAD/DEAH box helicase [Gemmatimonadaceae bacterium]|jgi:ATP-dependent RNA helicase DeaD|nr:DEAD/DEAH box helicase [Gemmatimonadaceae bacterium]